MVWMIIISYEVYCMLYISNKSFIISIYFDYIDVSMDICEDQITGIIGHNGAGKTTLFNILTRTVTPSNGTVSIYGFDAT